MLNVSFYGGETAGSVGEKIPSTKEETAGSVGIKSDYQRNFSGINSLNYDTVNFRSGNTKEESGTSTAVKVFGVATGAAIAVAALGYAHKTNAVEKLSDGKFKDIMSKTNIITEPCHKLCSKVKQFVQKHDTFFDWMSWIL